MYKDKTVVSVGRCMYTENISCRKLKCTQVTHTKEFVKGQTDRYKQVGDLQWSER